jgi:hypothetical protein
MRSLLTRMAVLGAFAVSIAACSNGNGTTLPFAGPPNNSGANSGTFQAGSNGTTLIRFVQGSPDQGLPPNGTVDVCVDQQALGVTAAAVNYKAVSALFGVPGGVPHTITAYNSLGANAGAECTTAPNPYFGNAPVAVAQFTANPSTRWDFVLGGTVASSTLGFYVFTEPSFATSPAGAEVISHNAAGAYSKTNKAVGFGTCSTTATPPATCTTAAVLSGAGNLSTPRVANKGGAITPTAATVSPLSTIPAGFYAGIGVAPPAAPVPVTVITAPAQPAGQPYVLNLYAIDGPAGTLSLISGFESTLNFGF